MSKLRAFFLVIAALFLVSSFTSAQCTPATSPAAKICSPVNGSTVTSPVHLVIGTTDSHRITEINTYVDNVSVYKTTTASSVDTTVVIAPGTHTLRIQVWDTTGTIYRDSVSITVSGSGPPPPPPSCTPATNPGAKICVPTSGSTVSSPFNVNVVTQDSAHKISAIYTYIDNVVVNKTNSASASFSATASNGNHNLRVQVWDSTGAIYRDSVNFTVGSGTPPPPPPPAGSVTVSPRQSVITPELTQQFTANTSVTWSVDGTAGGNATVGTISSSGLYTPPSTAGSHKITATSTADSTQSTDVFLYVTTNAGIFTYHNDNARTGQNTAETVLSSNNVRTNSFGKLFSRAVDGFVFAQPLYVRGVNVAGVGVRNIVIVATENASVYAFDADGRTSAPLWHHSYINPSVGVNPVTNTDVGNSDLGPEACITSTPVIDPSTNSMYVLVRTVEGGTYVQNLHLVSLSNGQDKVGAAKISATVNGSGVGGDGAGHISFDSKIENQRPALLLANGNVYIGWASHGDLGSYHGWLMVYNASTLKQVSALNLTPNGKDGGIWNGGSGPAADANGNVFFATGNGTNDVTGAAVDFGDTYMKVNASGAPTDYFTPYDQSALNSGDLDLGSSGVILLPDQSGAHPHILIGSGKRGDVYVIDRDAMGGFHAGSNTNAVQYLPRLVGLNSAEDQFFGTPSYWNGNVYFAGSFDHLKQFTFSGGLLSTSAVHSSPQVLSSNRSAEPVVSANGTSNGIVWVIATDTYQSNSAPLVLHAYDANDVSTELYNSAQAGSRDAGGKVVKFTTPTVVNGRVYVGTRNTLDVYGLLP